MGQDGKANVSSQMQSSLRIEGWDAQRCGYFSALWLVDGVTICIHEGEKTIQSCQQLVLHLQALKHAETKGVVWNCSSFLLEVVSLHDAHTGRATVGVYRIVDLQLNNAKFLGNSSNLDSLLNF